MNGVAPREELCPALSDDGPQAWASWASKDYLPAIWSSAWVLIYPGIAVLYETTMPAGGPGALAGWSATLTPPVEVH